MRNPCERFQKRIVLLLDGELPPEEADQLTAHIESCEGCRAEYEGFRALRDLWAEAPSLDSEASDRAAIVAAARQRMERSGWLERLLAWLTPTDFVTAGAVVTSVILVVLLVEGQKSTGLPPEWPRSAPVYSLAEYDARVEGTRIELEQSFSLGRLS
jgi:anti-sigma factor RsiW